MTRDRLRVPFDQLWIWMAVAIPALVALLVPLPAVDLAYQVRAGNEIMAARALPGVDTWTFTVYGTPWVDQQWLAQVAHKPRFPEGSRPASTWSQGSGPSGTIIMSR